uniref:Xylose isomerase-like TIM barrel domain-containing protein n=1 Tax=viral metagenome TaxID=1070528 RepID=A0A6C0J749_9ZZZZ
MNTIVGHNMVISKGDTSVSDALILMHRMGGNAMQIVLGEMTNIKDIIDIAPMDAQKACKIIDKYNKYIVVHGKYIYNFCHKDKIYYQDALFKELVAANSFKADVIIHQGKNVNKLTAEEARKTYANNIKSVIDMMKHNGLSNRIILENSAHQGTEIGYSLKELHQIWELFSIEERKYLGFCIDTCHIFVAGELDIRNPIKVTEWFNEFDNLIGKSHLKLIHLNDSTPDFNSHNDNHAALGKGFIGIDGLKCVAGICKKWNIPIIMETPQVNAQSEITMVSNW